MSSSQATVVETHQLSTRIRRIVLRVDDPTALAVPSAPDAAVGVYFPGTESGRNYSIRRHDKNLLTLDVVVHSHGPGTDWARNVGPGDRVGLDHARCWYRPAPDTDWQLLVCDLAGLPAAARIIEEHRDGPLTLIAEVIDRNELEYLPAHPELTVRTAVGTGNGVAPSRLGDLVRELPVPAGRGYCWFAGEAAQSRVVRKHLRGLGWTVGQTDIVGYWRFESEHWDARYAEVATEMFAVYQRAVEQGKDTKIAAEEYDAALERAGL